MGLQFVEQFMQKDEMSVHVALWSDVFYTKAILIFESQTKIRSPNVLEMNLSTAKAKLPHYTCVTIIP